MDQPEDILGREPWPPRLTLICRFEFQRLATCPSWFEPARNARWLFVMHRTLDQEFQFMFTVTMCGWVFTLGAPDGSWSIHDRSNRAYKPSSRWGSRAGLMNHVAFPTKRSRRDVRTWYGPQDSIAVGLCPVCFCQFQQSKRWQLGQVSASHVGFWWLCGRSDLLLGHRHTLQPAGRDNHAVSSPRDATDIRLVEDAMEELAERVWGMHGFSLTLMGSCLSGTDILKQFGQSDTVETMHWENLGTILRYPCKNGGLFWARWRPIFGFRRWHWEEKRLNFVTATWSWIGKLCPYKATLAMTWWHIQRWKGQQIQNGGMTCAQSFTCGILGLKMLWRLWSVYARHLMVILWRPWFAGSGRSILVLPRIPLAWCCSSI